MEDKSQSDDYEISSMCSTYQHEERLKSLEEMFSELKSKADLRPKLSTVYVKSWNKLNRVSDEQNCCWQNCWKETTGYCKEGHGVVWICSNGKLMKYSHSTRSMECDQLIMVLAEKEFMRADIPSDVPDEAYVVRFFEMKALPDPIKA